jgi:hypothetical protein
VDFQPPITLLLSAVLPPNFNDDFWSHNTIWAPDSWPFSGLAPMTAPTPNGACPPYSPLPVNRVIYKNSLVIEDFSGDCNTAGAILRNNYDNSIFANNALKGGNCCGGYGSVGAPTPG